MQDKKILIISHNSFSKTNNMGKTLSGLFGGFEKSNLAQLFFHVAGSDVDMCKTSYNITDKDILKSIFTFKTYGKIIEGIKELKDDPDKLTEKVYQFGQKRTASKHLARDIIWKLGRWKSKKLFVWIEEFKPDVIFYASGYAMFSYNIALFLSRKYKIPLITYFCDDYYDYNYSDTNSLVAQIRIKLFREKVKEIINESAKLIFISESMMKKYKELFNKEGIVIMTPYTFCDEEKKATGNILRLVYVGSVMSNRWKTLIKIGTTLEKINTDKLKIKLDIYSQVADEDIISKLSIGKSMEYKGVASSDQVKLIYSNADILLHIESFLDSDIIRVKHSISTKIADYLASSRVILAVGPPDIASIQYLEENNAAYVINDEEEILKKLEKYFINNKIEDEIINNAYRTAQNNHNPQKNIEMFKIILDELDQVI